MSAHILYVGGEDNDLRIPFILAMRNRGFRVSAAGSGNPTPFQDVGIDYVPFPFDRFISPMSDISALRRLAAMLNNLRPDIAQGYDTKPSLLLPLATRLSTAPTQVIRTICGRGWFYSSSSPIAWTARPVYRALHRIAAHATAATVFEIEDDRNFFRSNRMEGRRGVVIPAGGGGVDVAGFERALVEQPSREALRTELGLGNAQVVLTVTRMTRQKGIPSLLKAAEIVHRACPHARFVLVGPRESEGPLAVSEAEISRHKPYVLAVGARRDVPALMRMADVFAFPTEYREGVARVLLEASLAGLPIVSTAMPGCREVIRDGWNGLLTPTHDAESLAAGILRLLKDREAALAMARNAEHATRECFSLEAIADRHAKLYTSILKDQRGEEAAQVAGIPSV